MNEEGTDHELLTVSETAKYLRCSAAVVRKLAKSGQLEAFFHANRWLVSRDGVSRYLRSTMVSADATVAEGDWTNFRLPRSAPEHS